MALQFTQEEVEREINDIFHHGDKREIARIAAINESWLKRQLNPDDAEQSAIYRALLIICAEDEVDPERGEKLWQKISQLRGMSKPQKAAKKLCINSELDKADKEFSDIWKARLKGKGLYQQHSEICEALSQLKVLATAILADINAEKDAFNSPRNRFEGRL